MQASCIAKVGRRHQKAATSLHVLSAAPRSSCTFHKQLARAALHQDLIVPVVINSHLVRLNEEIQSAAVIAPNYILSMCRATVCCQPLVAKTKHWYLGSVVIGLCLQRKACCNRQIRASYHQHETGNVCPWPMPLRNSEHTVQATHPEP